MKLLALVLTVTLLFAAGEMLTCHRCVSRLPGEACTLSMETCMPEEDGCVAIKFRLPPCKSEVIKGHVSPNLMLDDVPIHSHLFKTDFFFFADGKKQKCMAAAACEQLKLNAYLNVTCCGGDMCNTI
ncbi:uncharacterized protein ly97.3 [Thalassophryne amazonica]|uniref:uncharacterized protein ly97.3 n=1 Tax=Thalassophryne amazonica TaxID=390379 RepID=UPI001471C83B|nr:uncharacterized protein ly97.3 [Thalassophryne amazonica]